MNRRQFLEGAMTFAGIAAAKAFIPGLELADRILNPDPLCALDVCHDFANTETITWIRNNSQQILTLSEQYHVPSDVVMAIIYREHVARRIYPGLPLIGGTDIHSEIPLSDDLMAHKQLLALAIENDNDVSIGPAQVQVSTARRLEATLIPEREKRIDPQLAQSRAISRLKVPFWNLAYACLNIQVEMSKLGIKYSPNPHPEDVQAIATAYNGSQSYGQDVVEYQPFFHAYANELYDGMRQKFVAPAHIGFQTLLEDELTPDMCELLTPGRPINLFVVHHTASEITTLPTIFLDHSAKGYGGIGYHGLIGNGILTSNGEYISTRPGEIEGVHAPPHNFDSLGIALVGNLNDQPPTDTQMNTLAHTWAAAKITYNLPDSALTTHKHIDPSTECPGSQLPLPNVKQLAKNITETWGTKWAEMGVNL